MIKFINFLMYVVQSTIDKLLDVYDFLKSCRMGALSEKLTENEKAIHLIKHEVVMLELQKERLESECEIIRKELQD